MEGGGNYALHRHQLNEEGYQVAGNNSSNREVVTTTLEPLSTSEDSDGIPFLVSSFSSNISLDEEDSTSTSTSYGSGPHRTLDAQPASSVSGSTSTYSSGPNRTQDARSIISNESTIQSLVDGSISSFISTASESCRESATSPFHVRDAFRLTNGEEDDGISRYRSVVDSLVLRQFGASGLVRIEGSTVHVLDHRNDLWSVSSVGDNITTSNSSNHNTIHTGGCESLRTPGITRIGYNDSDDGSLIAGDTIARRIFTEEDLELMVKERFEFWQGRVWNPNVISVSALPHHRRKGYNLFCICPSSPSKKGIQSLL